MKSISKSFLCIVAATATNPLFEYSLMRKSSDGGESCFLAGEGLIAFFHREKQSDAFKPWKLKTMQCGETIYSQEYDFDSYTSDESIFGEPNLDCEGLRTRDELSTLVSKVGINPETCGTDHKNHVERSIDGECNLRHGRYSLNYRSDRKDIFVHCEVTLEFYTPRSLNDCPENLDLKHLCESTPFINHKSYNDISADGASFINLYAGLDSTMRCMSVDHSLEIAAARSQTLTLAKQKYDNAIARPNVEKPLAERAVLYPGIIGRICQELDYNIPLRVNMVYLSYDERGTNVPMNNEVETETPVTTGGEDQQSEGINAWKYLWASFGIVIIILAIFLLKRSQKM